MNSWTPTQVGYLPGYDSQIQVGRVPTLPNFWWTLAAASGGLSAYHGYKRNVSIPWAVGWGVLGTFFPIIVPAIALAQGFGKRA